MMSEDLDGSTTVGPSDPVELARARHRLYGLLGQLLADGLVPELSPVVQALPALRPLLDASPEDLGAEHTRWLTHELSPHASAFLDGALNGPATAQARATWSAAGFGHGRTDLEDDHVAVFLAALSYLCAAELEARQDGIDPSPVLRLQGRVATELQAWLPLFTSAIEGPWSCVAGLVQELVDDHAPPPIPPSEAPERVGPDELLVPATCGWVCTWDALHRAGHAAGCPVGFGSKRRSLRMLLDDEVGRDALLARIIDSGPAAWRPLREAIIDVLRRSSTESVPGEPVS